jgi:hypothetical protein
MKPQAPDERRIIERVHTERRIKPRIIWLRQPVRLSRAGNLMVHGVSEDAPPELIKEWTVVGDE